MQQQQPLEQINPPQTLLNGKYRYIKELGKGAQGLVCQYTDGQQQVAVKFESQNALTQLQIYEIQVMRKLTDMNIKGVPKYISHGTVLNEPLNYLITELVEQSLEEYLAVQPSRQEALLPIFIQMIEVLQSIHNAGYVHYDVKPENFRVNPDLNQLYFIDFGLAKTYLNEETKEHIPDSWKLFKGTPAFASINQHANKEYSRRDDLECLGYCFLYLWNNNTLPWMTQQENISREDFKRIVEEMKKAKQQLNSEKVFDFDQDKIIKFIMKARSLEFQETPNYEDFIQIISAIQENQNYVQEYDKESEGNHSRNSSTTPLQINEEQSNEQNEESEQQHVQYDVDNDNDNQEELKNSSNHVDYYAFEDREVENTNKDYAIEISEMKDYVPPIQERNFAHYFTLKLNPQLFWLSSLLTNLKRNYQLNLETPGKVESEKKTHSDPFQFFRESICALYTELSKEDYEEQEKFIVNNIVRKDKYATKALFKYDFKQIALLADLCDSKYKKANEDDLKMLNQELKLYQSDEELMIIKIGLDQVMSEINNYLELCLKGQKRIFTLTQNFYCDSWNLLIWFCPIRTVLDIRRVEWMNIIFYDKEYNQIQKYEMQVQKEFPICCKITTYVVRFKHAYYNFEVKLDNVDEPKIVYDLNQEHTTTGKFNLLFK